MARGLDTEVVVPYGSRTGQNHFRFKNDYRTFCGRECEDWSVVENTTPAEVMDSSFTCKRCVEGLLK